jgi:hypothetical protein
MGTRIMLAAPLYNLERWMHNPRLSLHALGFTLVLVAVLLVLKPIIMRYFDKKRIEKQKQEAFLLLKDICAPYWLFLD